MRAETPETEAYPCIRLSHQAMNQGGEKQPGNILPPIQADLLRLLPKSKGCSAQWESWQCMTGKSASPWAVGREAFKDSIM